MRTKKQKFIAFCRSCDKIVIKDLDKPFLEKGKLKCPHCGKIQELDKLRYETEK